MKLNIKRVDNLTVQLGSKPASGLYPYQRDFLSAFFGVSPIKGDKVTGKNATAVFHDEVNVQTSARSTATTPLKIGDFSTVGGGIYAGISRGENGQPDAHLFLLNDKPGEKLKWSDAISWAAKLGNDARLPTRFESALLYANLQDLLKDEEWHWTGTQFSDYRAWTQHFDNGGQDGYHKTYEARARAVRRLVL